MSIPGSEDNGADGSSKRKRCAVDGDSITTINSSNNCSVGPRIQPQTYSSQRVKLLVGGEEFNTTYSTLVLSSPYFQAMLNGGYSESDSSCADPIVIDRDPFSFKIILAYLRTEILLCESSSLLASVIIEADFYGIASLLADVKLTCIRNLYPFKKDIEDCEKALALFDSTFSSMREFIKSTHFPGIYYKRVNYFRTVKDIPSSNHVLKIAGTMIPVISMCSFENISTGSLITEPMVYLESEHRLQPWTEIDPCAIKTKAQWSELVSDKTRGTQIVPASFALAYLKSFCGIARSVTWKVLKKSIVLMEGTYHEGDETNLDKDGDRKVFTKKDMRGVLYQDLSNELSVTAKAFDFGLNDNTLHDATSWCNFQRLHFVQPQLCGEDDVVSAALLAGLLM